MEGKVKFFKEDKNFGFITDGNDQDYFVHGSQVEDGLYLTNDLEVSFDAEEGDRGMVAKNVRKLEAADEEEADEE